MIFSRLVKAGHTGFCPRIDKSHHLDTGNRIDDHFGEDIFLNAGRAEAGSFVQGFVKGGDHFRMSVATDGWAPGSHIVDILVTVHVLNVGALNSIEYDRLSSHGFKGAHRGTNPPGHQFLGGGKDFFRFIGLKRRCANQSFLLSA
jgi:hypothetical protein